MRIVHMTSVHEWDDPRIFSKMCRSLAQVGHEVHLVAPRRDCSEIEIRDRVHVHAVPPPRNRLERMWRTRSLILRRATGLEAEIYHFHDPELIPVGLRLKIGGRRVVYDVHEDVPKQILSKEWIPRCLRTVVSRIEKHVEALGTQVFDGIVAATPAIACRFPQYKTATVQNFPIPEEFTVRDSLPVSKRAPLAAYIGGITRLRGIHEVVSAMSLLPKSLQVRLALAGQFAPATLQEELRRAKGWRRVDYRGWCSRPDVASLLAEASMGLVTFLPAPNHYESQPHKLFEYMSAGLPVVASDFPLWRRIIGGETGCGLLVDPRDPRTIADAIQWLLMHPREAERMGRRGRSIVREGFNWEKEFPVLLGLYHSVLNGRRKNGCNTVSSSRNTR